MIWSSLSQSSTSVDHAETFVDFVMFLFCLSQLLLLSKSAHNQSQVILVLMMSEIFSKPSEKWFD